MTQLSLIITGASSGIGRATALAAAQSGHSLLLVGRNEPRLQAVAQECLINCPRVAYEVSDVSQDDGERLAQMSEQLPAGRLVLVNNAGAANFGSFHGTSIEEHLGQIDVMLSGTLRTTHALLPEMLKRGGGTVINVLSVAAVHTFPNAEAYSAAKAGVLAFSKCLGESYKSQGTVVIGLILGATDTPLWERIEWSPPREDMLSAQEVARKIIEIAESSLGAGFHEETMLPPKGIL